MSDSVYWALWLAAVIVGTAGCGLAIAAMIKWCDTPSNKYVDRDWRTEQRCKATRRGFKTRMGAR